MRRMVAREIDKSTFRGRVADALRTALIDSGLSQKDLANRLGCQPENLSMILSGKQNMTLDKVDEIMRAMGKQVTIF